MYPKIAPLRLNPVLSIISAPVPILPTLATNVFDFEMKDQIKSLSPTQKKAKIDFLFH